MRKITTLVFAILQLALHPAMAQSVIRGVIKDQKNDPVPYASILIKGNNIGTTADSTGSYKLVASLKGTQTLLVSYIGYDKLALPIIINSADTVINIVLKAGGTALGEVVISAGTIQTGNDNAVAILNSNDIVTTAGGQGDIVGAIQTLPGVQRNGGDQTGLQVHGGDVSESVVIIDGSVAQNAFLSPIPGVSQRSRFTPFQFKGTSFSTGGYSVRYGQALSSLLELETNDLPKESALNAQLSFSGASLSGTQLLGDNAVTFSGNYINLKPFFGTANTTVDYTHVPTGGGFGLTWVSKISARGLFKMNLQQGVLHTGVMIPDPQYPGSTVNFDLKNDNTFYNASYRQWLNDQTRLFTSFSLSNNTDQISLGAYPSYHNDSRAQGRVEIYHEFAKPLTFLAGIDAQHYHYLQKDTLYGNFTETLTAAFVESEWKPQPWIGFKIGTRVEYSSLLKQSNIAPRVSAALKISRYSQISGATGIFYQSANPVYLMLNYKPDFQKAIHYILNYTYQHQGRTFRLEGYYKDYSRLIRENGIPFDPNNYRFNFGRVDNSGYGTAKGADLFWRDKASVKNFDYWISYSYIDTKRLFQNYTTAATPNFISSNNLNLIAKYFIDGLQTNISASYNYASGRGYYNPANQNLFEDKTPAYQNLAVTLSYLRTFKRVFAVFYASLDNITNQHNILGYRYSASGNNRYPILPPVYRSIFLGVNLSLTKFAQDEL